MTNPDNNKKFSLIIVLLLLLLGGVALFIGSWYVLHGDLNFHTDIARDFLLMQEISSKKVVLIGPRADWKGLFHGPLWLYFNYPAFFIGNGNPVIVGWYWVAVTALFSSIYYFLYKNIFGQRVALLFSILFLVCMETYMNNFYNPTGALFMAPLFFYFAIYYYKKRSIVYMMLHLLFVGFMAQFQLAAGIPFIILSSLWLMYEILKTKKYSHLLGFFILIIPFAPTILFNIKHHFSYVTAVIDHFSGKEQILQLSLREKISNRIEVLSGQGLGFFSKGEYNAYHVLIGYLMAIGIFIAIKSKELKNKFIYILFLYFYFGFYILSLIHNNLVLSHYFLPFITLPILIFCSLYELINKKIFAIVYILIVLVNFYAGYTVIHDSEGFIGKDKTSWKFMSSVATKAYNMAGDNNFGLYVYAPDVYAYAGKYAVSYTQTLFPTKKMHYNQKLRETILIYEPAPSTRPELNGDDWKIYNVKIKKSPVAVYTFPNGYKIEKYILTENEQMVKSDSLIDDWISQR